MARHDHTSVPGEQADDVIGVFAAGDISVVRVRCSQGFGIRSVALIIALPLTA